MILVNLTRFNLVIEMLVISGSRHASSSKSEPLGFNLVIEMLVISGNSIPNCPKNASTAFQSRNRDACHFRCAL